MKPQKTIKQSGFTLIELIVVLAILGFILAIAVPNYMGVQAKATETADHREAELLADTMKRALADGTILVKNKKLYGEDENHKSDGIAGYRKFIGTGKSFDEIFKPLYYSEVPGPDAPDAGNNRTNSELQRYMFEVLTNPDKVKIWIGSKNNKTYLAEFSY